MDIAGAKDRAVGRVADTVRGVRRERPWLDHLVRMQEHYGNVNAGQQAGAVTYFGFLSFFPVLALAVFVVGGIRVIWPDAEEGLTDAINQVIPGLVGPGEGQVSLDSVQRFSGWAGIAGLLGVVYAGLGWVSATRTSLEVVFELPPAQRPNLVTGKLWDLLSLVVIGSVLLVSVVLAGFVTESTDTVLGWLGLGEELGWLVWLLGRLIGLAVSILLVYAVLRLAGRSHTPQRALWKGALLGGAGFEALKALSLLVLGSAKGSPAFQAFGVALVLVVWINYVSRVVLYAAAYAHTSPEARRARAGRPQGAPVQGPATPPLQVLADGQAALVREQESSPGG